MADTFGANHVSSPAAKCRVHGKDRVTVTIRKKDPRDPDLPEASVRLMREQAHPVYTATQRTAKHKAVFDNLEPGRYEAIASAPGYAFVPSHVQAKPSHELELVAVPNTHAIWGCDTNQQTLNLARATSGPRPCTFVGRYLSHDGNPDAGDQPLDATEAPRYRAAGLDIVAIWESAKYSALASPDIATETGYGTDHANQANAQLAALGTSNQVVYFTADFTISKKQWLARDGERIKAYFTGIKNAMHVNYVGAYGTYVTLMKLFDLGLISHGWQMTFGSKGNQIDKRVHIYQYDVMPEQAGWLATAHAGGLDMDVALVPRFGQFRL